jgi:hypothetical protein
LIELLRKYLAVLRTPSVALASLGLAAFFFAAIFVLLWLASPSQLATAPPTAALTVIPGATSTPIPPTATATLAGAETEIPTPAPGQIGIGVYVQIIGTGGGLNIRANPGLEAPILFLGFDSEVFEVRDGPRQADGLTWWLLVTPVDEARSGWAAADFLSVVPNP